MKKNFRVLLPIILAACLSILAFSSISSFEAGARAPTPTATHKPGSIFSPKTYNKNKKSGIQAILQWFRGGGAGPLILCDNQNGPPAIQFERMSEWKFSNTFEQMDGITILGCNWTGGEQLELTIKYPDGRTLTQTMPAQGLGESWGGIYYDFRPTLDDPTGKYTVTIRGNSATVSGSFPVVKPSGVNMYWLGNNNLLLRGFSPSETVQIVAYDRSNQFQGWSDYQVGRDGSLWLQIEALPRSIIMASSLNKGIDLVLEIPEAGMEKAVELCTQTLPPRLRTGAWAAALENVAYYSSPESKSIIRKMQPQSQHHVLGGPWCMDGKFWWKLESKKGFTGYVVEADRAKYYLIPVE